MAENDGLSKDNKLNEKSADSELGSLYKAISSGDHEEIARLMADGQELTPEEEDENATPKVEEEEESSETDIEPKNEKEEVLETDDSKPAPKPEAAKPAASTANASDTDEVTQLKAQLEELRQQNHRIQSDAGRVPYLQRRLAELEKQARAPAARPVTPVNSKTTFTAEDYKNVELDPDTQKEIDDLKEIDPTMAKALERTTKTAILTAQRQFQTVLQEREKVDQEIDNERFYLEQKAELARTVPQHEEIFRSKEWGEWKQTLTPGQRALAESGHAADVVQAIYSFAAEMRKRYPQTETQGNGQEQVTPPEAPPSEVSKERARKTDTAPSARNPTAKPAETFDEEALFGEMYRQIGKESHILK